MKSSNLKNDKDEKSKENLLVQIKSVYFLGNLLKSLRGILALNIIKYNKTIQKRFGINVNHYKKYCEIYSPIEIEIIPAKNLYGKFINYQNDEDKPYFHIYFNDSKEEIKRNYLNKRYDIKDIKIKVIIDYKLKSFSGLFKYCKIVESITFKRFHRNNISSMQRMFEKCTSLKVLNLTNFRTDNVTDMSGMFMECSSLEELNLSKFNTENVTDMNEMFIDCEKLKELNLSNFNTSKVNSMKYMFLRCSSLKVLNLSNFNTDNVIDMYGMFCFCSSLKELDLSNFNTKNVTDMGSMFSHCSTLEKLDISNFNTDNVIEENMYFMFFFIPDELKKKIKNEDKNKKFKDVAYI